MATNPSIGDLTKAMKQFTQSGAGKDLKLSPTAAKEYTALIRNYRGELHKARAKAEKLTTYGNVGEFYSAVQTMEQLTQDVTGPDGFLASLDKYIAYLDQFEDAVNAACKRIAAEDNA